MARAALGAWSNFYVIVGSSAAALTGLQFVVIAIVKDVRDQAATKETVDAFGTPTVVHFSAVLLASAIMTAPWRSIGQVAAAVGIWSIGGLVYGSIVLRRARRQTGYQPVLEDWIWHAFLPLLAYASAAAAAISVSRHPEDALLTLGAASLLLLFIGIHNAWDTVTYVAVAAGRRESTEQHSS